jgi:26S proteasome regulatory subunit N9
MAAAQFITELQASRPDVAPALGELADLHAQRLWHELTLKLEEVVAAPAFCAPGDDLLVRLYTRFVSDFEERMNQLKLAHIAVAVSARLGEPGAAIAFLQGVAAKVAAAPRAEAPLLYIRTHVALLHLQSGDLAAAKTGVEEGRAALDALSDADSSVSAAVYFVAAQLAKAKQDFAEFYKAGLLYLAYVSTEALPEATKLVRAAATRNPSAGCRARAPRGALTRWSAPAPPQELAVDLSLAALLGENIFNFGELLGHPVLASLRGSGYEWLAELLAAFNAGDLAAYDALCAKHAAVLNAQPALVAAERALREKITILALTEIVFALPAEERTISLATIAAKTQLSSDGVERLLMKTLSVHLIEGIIDQAAGTVRITWVQPRVLLPPQVADLRARLDGWINKVHAARLSLEAEAELVGTA